MKLKIFFLIFSLQFILYSCDQVLYYQALIEKYSDEITVYPNTYKAVGFVLDIKDFKENEKIYFIFTIKKFEDKNNSKLRFLKKSESKFDIPNDTDLSAFSNIESLGYIMKKSDTSFYFETTKNSPNLNYLKIVLVSEIGFESSIIFKNTEEEESEKEYNDRKKFYALFFSFWAFIIALFFGVSFGKQYKNAKRKKIVEEKYRQSQQMNDQQITQPQDNRQDINTQLEHQQENDSHNNLRKVGNAAHNNFIDFE